MNFQLTENEEVNKTLIFRWKAANLTAGALNSVSREMMREFKLSLEAAKLNSSDIDLFSCSKCHTIFTPDKCTIRSVPKRKCTVKNMNKFKSAPTGSRKDNFYKKMLNNHSVITARCKVCNNVSKVDSVTTSEIQQINLAQRKPLKEMIKAQVKPENEVVIASVQKSKAMSIQALKRGLSNTTTPSSKLVDFKQKNNSSFIGSSMTKKKNKKGILGRSSQLADMLKGNSSKKKPSGSLSDFLSSI